MDKETLSHYGWTVVIIFISALLLSIASPTGSFIVNSGISAYGELSTLAGSSVATPTFYSLAQIESDDHLWAIGRTKPEYVVAVFNEDYTEVVISKNGIESDGLMKDFRIKSAFASYEDPLAAWKPYASPMAWNADTLVKATVEHGVTSLGASAFSGCSKLITVTIPETVTKLATTLFLNCSSLEEIEIPGKVTEIPNACFQNCSKLAKAIIPDTVEKIGSQAFYSCKKLVEFNTPKNLKSIGVQAFCYCSIPYFNLPEGLERIEKDAFRECHEIVHITIPSTTTFIAEQAFRWTSSLRSIYVAKGNRNYTSVDGVLYSYDKTVLLCRPCKAYGTEYTVLPTVTRIASSAFNSNTITTVNLPDSLVEFGDRAFESCTQLLSLHIPKNVKEIGQELVFFNVYLRQVTVDKENQYFKVVNEGLYSMDETVFYFFPADNARFSGLRQYTLLPTVKKIEPSAFYEVKNLEEITVPEGITTIPTYCFSSCDAEVYKLPSTVNTIESVAFYGSSAKSIVIPEGVSILPSSSFESCRYLVEITIPSSVTEINSSAFYNCKKLATVYGVSGSYAETWALKNGYTFIAI